MNDLEKRKLQSKSNRNRHSRRPFRPRETFSWSHFLSCYNTYMKKIQIIILSVVIFALPCTSFATEPATIIQAPSVPTLITKVQEAKQLLAPLKLNYALTPHYKTTVQARTKTKKQVLTNYTLDIKDIALAILDPAGNIHITAVMQKGSNFEFPDKNFSVTKTSFNGVNSRFTVQKPAGGKVIALKYLITPTESGSRVAIEKAMYPVDYVPYSPELSSPEVVAYGASYLNTVIDTVASQLKNTASQSVPGKLITEAIPPSIIKALAYAEHTSSANIQSLGSLEQMNVLLATNGPDTYKYSVSSDGYFSRGIAQFIPSTYASLISRHKDLNFIQDFKLGMEDHVNSVKAMYVLLDDYAGSIRQKAPQNFLESRTFEYGAAAYNGGVTRVAKALSAYGDAWNNRDRLNTINSLQAQANTASAQIKKLSTKIKSTKEAGAKTALKKDLATAQANKNSAESELATLTNATLRNETINYLNKIYSVIHLLNAESKPTQLALQ